MVAAAACMPPLQLVDTLSLLRRRGPSLPLHSRWIPALPCPAGSGQAHEQQGQTFTVSYLSALRILPGQPLTHSAGMRLIFKRLLPEIR